MSKETFDFSEALRRMKEGKRVRREIWEECGAYIYIVSKTIWAVCDGKISPCVFKDSDDILNRLGGGGRMKGSVSYFGNVYYLQDGNERMRQVFGKQHYEIIAQATKLASSLKVSRLKVVAMHYNKNLENYMNVTEWFDYNDGKFKLKDKFKEMVL